MTPQQLGCMAENVIIMDQSEADHHAKLYNQHRDAPQARVLTQLSHCGTVGRESVDSLGLGETANLPRQFRQPN